MRRFQGYPTLILVLSLSSVSYAGAQQDTLPRRDSSVVRLPTLDVKATATRSTRGLMEQPIAITTIRPNDWFGGTGFSLDQALGFVPGVIATTRYGGTDVKITIRGFGSRGAGDRSNSGTSRGVRVVTDGFPDTEPDGRTSFDLVDLGAVTDIEVIRSNASATWGNAAGGVVSVSTLRNATTSYGTIESSVGSFGLRRVLAQGGTPLGQGLGGFTLTRTVTGGYRAHSDGERTLLNLGMTTPVGRSGKLGVFASGTSNFFRIPGPLTRTQAEQTPEAANATYAARDERRHNRLGRLGVVYEHHQGERHEGRATIYIQPKFLQRSERGTFRDFTRYHVGGSLMYRYNHQLGAVPSSFSVGADEAYQDGAILFYSLSATGERGAELRSNKREGANNFGVFVQEELNFGERWGVSLGARFDNITYYSEDFLEAGLSGSRSFTHITPKLGLNFRRSSTHSIYLNVGGGVEAPAGNETDPAGTFGQDSVLAINPLLEPILSTTVEVGTKHITAIGDSRNPWILSYDAALYYTSVRNEIVPYRGGRFYFTAGEAGRGGAELGGQIQHGPVTLTGSFAYAHYRYLDYVVDSVHYGNSGAFADYADNKVVGIPDFTYAAGLQWAPGALHGVQARIHVSGATDYWADDANSVNVPGHGIVSATVALGRPLRLGGRLGLRGFVTVNNVFDRTYVGSVFLNPDIVNGDALAFEPGAPRSAVVSVSLGWQ